MVYNVNLKKVKGRLSTGIILTLVGIVFLVILIVVYISSYQKSNDMDSSTKATEVYWERYYEDDGYMYSPTYHYRVDGNEYTCDSTSSGSSKSGGNGVVYYESSNPSNCITDYDKNSGNLLILLLLIPIVFIIIGVFQLFKTAKKTKIVKQLAYNGVLVKGIPYHLVPSGIEINDVALMCISAFYTFPDGQVKEIKSEPLKPNLIYDNDNTCDLLYDPSNNDNYYVDFEITTTGVGSPNIVYFDNSINQAANQYTNQNNSYNPNNKF